MKRYITWLVLGSLSLAGCKEPVLDEGILPLTEPATADANGGNWRTVVLQSAAEVDVPQPAAITSDAYQRELNEVKNELLSLNPEQNTAINYWAGGGVLRWNQLARLLVAKYNVEPGANNATGTGTGAPSPFAHSLPAARLFALLSVAQYDALVVAWRAKYRYNRPSLRQQGVQTRVPTADVPSYPSEDAAVAEASYQLLTHFFPAEADWLRAKAAEHKQSRIWAGAGVPSDVKAGEALAAVVAARVLARAREDRLDGPRDPNATYQTLLANAAYDVKWTSLEIPARLPVLPPAGRIRTWYDSAALDRARPGPPPMTTSAEFGRALAEVRDVADARTREQWRIANLWEDGVGTYTIPGHWNFIAETFIRQARQNELRAARTYALMNRALQDGAMLTSRARYAYFVPRPSQLDARVKTAVRIPNLPSYPSDHATFASAAATVLTALFPDETADLSAQAAEAVASQFYGGVHYRFDTEAGAACGAAVGRLSVDWAKADGGQ